MPQSKKIQEQMRNNIVDMYQSGKGYKAISKALGLQRTMVRAIIHKWRKLGTVVNLPRSGRPTRITEAKETGQKRHPWESSKAKASADQNIQKGLSHVCQKIS